VPALRATASVSSVNLNGGRGVQALRGVCDTGAVLERDRPIEERVSVLDRPRTDVDALPPMMRHGQSGLSNLTEIDSLKRAARSLSS
jgi:hypothetical protein